MPIINAPFRLYYAYNPLRLYERPYCNDALSGQKQYSCSAELITRAMFPPGGAGDYTYQEAIQSYGAQYRLPRAAQDLPPDDLNNVLIAVRFPKTEGPLSGAAIHLARPSASSMESRLAHNIREMPYNRL